jgi:hypothetical protein
MAVLSHAPVATEVYRQLLRQDFHLLERTAFARRTTKSGNSMCVRGVREGDAKADCVPL